MRGKKLLSGILSFAILLSLFALMPSNRALAAATQRLEDTDRYGTAIAISKAGWQTADNVILATGNDYPDALSAAPLARQLNAPILLVDKSVDLVLETELDRLQAKHVFIVGGEGVVSVEISEKLDEKGLEVTRLFGDDRYGTSIEIAKYLKANFNIGSDIVVATGEDFPDALSIAPIAAAKGMPILLSERLGLPDSVKNYISDNNVAKAFVIGGTGVVSDRVMQQLPSPERLYGLDRFETNISVLKRFVSDLSFDKAYVATGTNFPDALAGSSLASKTSSPIILVDKIMPGPTAAFMDYKLPYVKEIGVLGGEGVVPQFVLTSNVYGNTHGNISNFGFAASQGDWVYYNNNTLYKVKFDGTGKTEISKDVPVFINVVGDWVYYIDVSDDTNKMYKVRTNGTGRTKLSDDVSLYMAVVGDWIYYMNASDQGKLYKMKTDGTSKTRLANEIAMEINVSGDWVYYLTQALSGAIEVHKVRTDGTGLTMLYGASGMAFLNVSGDYLYFETTDVNGQNGDLVKVKTDGTDYSTISYDSTEFVNVLGDWIYYSNASDGSKLYKMKIDGTGNQKINDDDALFINVVGDWIYYGTASQENTIKVKIDGTERQIVN